MSKRIYISESLFEKLVEVHPSMGKEEVTNNAVDTFLKLRRSSLASIKGMFSREEIVGMIDGFNGTLIQGIPIPAKDILLAQMADVETYDHGSVRHGYDWQYLSAKITAMHPADAEYWLQELIRFWNEMSSIDGTFEMFLDEYSIKA